MAVFADGSAGDKAQAEPDRAEDYRRKHIRKEMRAEGNPAESHQDDQGYRTENARQPPVAIALFEHGQNNQQKLAIQQSCSNRVATCEAVARPIDEWPIHERAMTVNKNFYVLIEQHAAGHGDDQGHERRPRAFPGQKDHQRKQNNSNPLSGAKLSESAQHGHKNRRKALMKPSGKPVVGARQRIRQCQRQAWIRGEKRRGNHKCETAFYRKMRNSQPLIVDGCFPMSSGPSDAAVPGIFSLIKYVQSDTRKGAGSFD